ncbi:MAG: FeoA family protein [Planctomycetota bacterium]
MSRNPAASSLLDLPRLGRARVLAVTGDDATAERLVILGFAPGTEVAFVRRAPLAGPLVVDLRGAQICVRASEARRILIAPMEAG